MSFNNYITPKLLTVLSELHDSNMWNVYSNIKTSIHSEIINHNYDKKSKYYEIEN